MKFFFERWDFGVRSAARKRPFSIGLAGRTENLATHENRMGMKTKARKSAKPRSDGRISKILIVCMGNICRSPYAAAALKKALAERGVEGVTVQSAGTTGGRIPNSTKEAIKVARERGIDLSRHRSRAMADAPYEGADLILASDKRIRDEIAERFPDVSGKVKLLTEWIPDASRGGDVIDPYGLDVPMYRSVFDRIDAAVAALADELAS
ncbi:hypothetical protein K8I61_04570 [bacterium]|nr:hypothetical protein [bacterium]